MKDLRSYLIWAHVQWLEDSGEAPHIVIKNDSSTIFPPTLQNQPHVNFNITSSAVKGLRIDEDGISFSARFSGKEHQVYAKIDSLLRLSNATGSIAMNLSPVEDKPAPREEVVVKANPIPADSEYETDKWVETEEADLAPSSKPPTLRLIVGGTSDGIPRGSISIVKKQNENAN